MLSKELFRKFLENLQQSTYAGVLNQYCRISYTFVSYVNRTGYIRLKDMILTYFGSKRVKTYTNVMWKIKVCDKAEYTETCEYTQRELKYTELFSKEQITISR